MFEAYRAWVRGLMGEPGVWLRLADGSWRRGDGARLDAPPPGPQVLGPGGEALAVLPAGRDPEPLAAVWLRAEVAFLEGLLGAFAMETRARAHSALLALLRKVLEVHDAGVFVWRRGRFFLEAHEGRLEPAEREVYARGLAPGQGVIWEVYARGGPLFLEHYPDHPRALDAARGFASALAVAPVATGRRPRTLLAVRHRGRRVWTWADRRFLTLAAGVFRETQARWQLEDRIAAHLRLERALPEASEAAFFQAVLEEAVRLVPGAEAGSLLVREGERYHYRASVGYPLEVLAGVTFDEAAMRDWAGEAWETGEPRLLSRRERPLEAVSFKTAPREVMATAGRVYEMQQNLCVPIVYRGRTIAALNLDAFSDPEAFDATSLEAARGFAVQVAAMLHEAELRRELGHAAMTDPLTGCYNRRAFERLAREELAASIRAGRPVALVVLDLAGFKRINDRYGHPAGDRTLQAVAEALAGVLRQGERLFRWGGDEFAAVLPGLDCQGARRVAARMRRALRGVRVRDLNLDAHFGLAVFPEEARDLDGLMRRADARLYRAKRRPAPNGYT